MNSWKKIVLSLLLSALASVAAFGQATASGTIEGTVVDNSQAVVVGAQVVATFKATGVTRTATTNETGTYRFDFVPAGTYQIKVSKTGFASWTQTTELLIGQTATVNASLKLGSASETVEVTDAAPIVDLTKTSVSVDITPSEVQNLPLVGRDAANLAYLAPGVKAADSYDPTKQRYAILSINGSDGRNVNLTVNGVDNKDNTVGGPVMQLPLEAVQEFQISTQRFSAENGRSQGAAINVITKSGSNSYHGSVFGYFRNNALDLDEKIPNGDGSTTTSQNPDYSRQFFGGSVGGPIKKDKLFGFFAIERQRESQGLAEDPKAYSELVLAKNAGLAADPAQVVPTPFYETRYNGRMDYNINSRNSAYLSYSSQANNSLNDQSNGTFDLTEGNFTVNHLQIANLTLNSQISNTSVNQFTFGWQYWNNLIDSTTKVPLVTFPNAQFGTNVNVPQQSYQRKWQFKDDYSKTIGNHTLKAGIDFIYNPVEGGFFESNSTLEIDFTQNPDVILGNPTLYPQGFGTAGLVGSMAYANGDPYFLVATKQLGLYAQDDWKVTPRLTVNLGLRWDRDFNALGESLVTQSRTYQELVALNSPISNPWVAKLPHDDTKDFSPRIGFAYDLTGAGKHVVRGGFGLYYGNSFQNIPLFMEQQANPTIFQGVLSLSSPTDPVPGTGLTLGQWQYGISPLPTLPAPSTQLASGSVGRLIDPNYRNPVAEEFNLGYTYAVNNGTAVEVEYTHVLGLHENKTFNLDQKVPQGLTGTGDVNLVRPLDAAFAASGLPELASVRDDASVNRNRYDGINFSYRQRMSHNFTLNANYTLAWAYGYDTGGGIGAAAFRNYARNSYDLLAPYEWGPTSNDERHHITLSGVVQLPMGFQFAPILQFGSARPYNLTNSANTINTGGGTSNAVVVPVNNPTNFFAYAGNNVGAQDCFYLTNNCTIAKFDPVRGDAFFQLDTRLSKSFKIGEKMNLQIVAQAFNLTNRANYGNNFGNSIADAASFGHPVGFINPSSTSIPRALWGEFGVHLNF